MSDTTKETPQNHRMTRSIQLGQVFTPGAPVDKYNLFAGRSSQIHEVINCINQRGQHVIIHGERGVGKTSLASVLHEILTSAGLKGLNCGSVNCDGTDDFTSLWKKVLREIMFTQKQIPIGFDASPVEIRRSLDEFIGKNDDLTPDDVRFSLQRFQDHTIIILDEVDRLHGQSVTTSLADTIKNLSDHSTNTTLVLVGVADSVEELIGEHLSIERALVQIKMQRMSSNELMEIIDKGLGAVGMTIDQEVKVRIADLSQGLPHFTHLLALHASQNAIHKDRLHVKEEDLQAAVQKAVNKAQQSIISAYRKATTSSQKGNLYSSVLLACAQAEKDDLGYFNPPAVRDPLTRIMGKPYDIPQYGRHLHAFCKPERGEVLKKSGVERRYQYRFTNPMMQPYIILRAHAAGDI